MNGHAEKTPVLNGPPPPPPRGMPAIVPRNQPEQGTLVRSEKRRDSDRNDPMTMSVDRESHSFAEDTMGQLKRTFAGIFGDVS
ncbi:unnamed protein product, partial [Mesorhabditis spiculigera]